MRTRSRLLLATCLAVVAAVTAATPAPRGAAAEASPMPVTSSSQLNVLSANVIEMWNKADLAEDRDLVHLARRIRAVLDALNTPAPDVVLLQEVNKESTATVAQVLTESTGRKYAVAVDASPGTGSVESKDGDLTVRRETAIVYNTATVTISAPAASLITIPPSQVPTGYEHLGLRQATALVTKKSDPTRKFAVYSVHLPTHLNVEDHDLYGGIWADFLKKRVAEIPAYAGATPVIGGDFNRKACINETNPALASQGFMTRCTGASGEQPSGLWSAMTTASSSGPGTYRALRPASQDWVDNIFTTATIVSGNRDYDYKVYGPEPTRFANVEGLRKCHALYNGGKYTPPGGSTVTYPGGQGGSDAAAGIQGCRNRYYSDHDFIWAVIQ